MGVYIPPCSDVQCSVNVCVCDIATVCAVKVLAVANTNVSTLVAGLRSVGRRDGDNLNACHFAFVFEERAELVKIPRVTSPAERLVTFLGIHAPADVLQVLDGDAPVFFFCLCYEPLADTVVHNGGESSLPSFQPFQQLMTVTCAFGLDRSSHFVVSISYIFDSIRRNISTIGQRNNVSNTHVNAKKIFSVFFFPVRNVYCLIKIELILDANKVCFAFCILHELWTIASVCYLFTPSNKRNRTDGHSGVIRKYATIISDSPKLSKMSLFLPVKFIRISNLAYCSYNELRRKVIRFFNGIIDFFMQAKLLEHMTFPRYLRDNVASLVENAECLFQYHDLLICWKQFNLQCQFHNAKIQNSFDIFKYLKEVIMLNLTKEGIEPSIMKYVRKHPAEAFHITSANWIKAIKSVVDRTELICHYGRKMANIQSGMSIGRFPNDGYFVLDNGTMDYLTEDEFNEMYKPLK
jgi:hypothetical protein